jgi:hypothetical protein
LLRGCSGTLTKRIILVQDVNVLLALRALDLLQVCSNLIWPKHASHLGNKPRQLSREVGMSGGSIGKIHQLFTDKIIEGGREPIACLDRLSRLVLLNPNLMRFAVIHKSTPTLLLHMEASARRQLDLAGRCECAETTIVCGILLGAFRDLIDFHRLNAPLGEAIRALPPEIELLINAKHEAGWVEPNDDLIIQAGDLVRYGFKERAGAIA